MKPFENCPFGVEPYDQSQLVKPANLGFLNYTNQDFASLKTRIVELLQERHADIFSDFVESQLAIMLSEVVAFVGDTLSFKIDQTANEVFIDTVQEVSNAFRLAKLMGFYPQPPIASRSFWSATIVNILSADVVIPTPLSVTIATEEGAKTIELFQADSNNNPLFNEPIIIPSGSFDNTSIIGLEGKTRTDFFRGNGGINQSFQLSFGPVIWQSIQVDIDGTTWTEVDFFTDSQPRKEYRVEYDSAYNAYLVFGNNRAGLIPSAQSDIIVTYRTGGGPVGNIVSGAVTFQQTFSIQGFGFNVPVSFVNYTKGEFGYSGDTLEDIKRKLPLYNRSQNRCVSGDDYQIFAENFSTPYHGQVGKAIATLRNHGCAANIVDLFILARDGVSGLQEASNDLKVDLLNALENLKMITHSICIKNGVILSVDISVDVVLDKFYRKFEEEFRIRIQQRVNTFFSLNRWNFGDDLKNIDLIKELSDITEFRSLEINFTTTNTSNSGNMVTAKYYEIIRPDTIDITFLYN